MISVFSNKADSMKEVLLEKQIVTFLLKKLPAFEGNTLPWTRGELSYLAPHRQ